jgi:hypothetical protein
MSGLEKLTIVLSRIYAIARKETADMHRRVCTSLVIIGHPVHPFGKNTPLRQREAAKTGAPQGLPSAHALIWCDVECT